MPVAIIPQPACNVKMNKFQVKRSNFLIEPANRSTETSVGARSSRPFTKSTMLETIGEIVGILAIFIIGWIAWVVF